jgi:hypothetical protein
MAHRLNTLSALVLGALSIMATQAQAQSCLTIGNTPVIEILSFGTDISPPPWASTSFTSNGLSFDIYGSRGQGFGSTVQAKCLNVEDPRDIYEVKGFFSDAQYTHGTNWNEDPNGIKVAMGTPGSIQVDESESMNYDWSRVKCTTRPLSPATAVAAKTTTYPMENHFEWSASLDSNSTLIKPLKLTFPSKGNYEVICSAAIKGQFDKYRITPTSDTTGSNTDDPGYPYGLAVKERASFKFTKQIGGLIDSTIAANVTSGIVPFKVQLSSAITNPNLASISSTKYQRSSDGVRWANITLDANSEFLVNSGGDNFFRTLVTNTNSKSTQPSESVKVTSSYAPLPSFAPVVKVDSMFAPSLLSIKVGPATAQDAAIIGNRKLKYAWNLPQGVTGSVNGNALTSIIANAGAYDFSVNVTDDFGGSVNVPYHVDIAVPTPISLVIAPKLAQRYNRAPAVYGITKSFTGGHPKDRPVAMRLFVDGVKTAGNLPGFFTIETAGTHTLRFEMDTKMGMSASKEVSFDVPANAAPVCPDLAVTWDTKKTAARVVSACTDSDGLIKNTVWSVNGVEQVNSNKPAFIWTKGTSTSADVTVTVTDDLGLKTSASTTLQ